MTLPAVARLLVVLGRLIGFAGAALTAGTLIAGVYYLFFRVPDQAVGLGLLPLVVALRFTVAACVIWCVIKSDARTLFRILLIVGVGSFLGLGGWYFLLLRQGFELLAIGDALYLVAGLMVGFALLLPRVSARLGNDSP
jgi:hypothetical protein